MAPSLSSSPCQRRSKSVFGILAWTPAFAAVLPATIHTLYRQLKSFRASLWQCDHTSSTGRFAVEVFGGWVINDVMRSENVQ